MNRNLKPQYINLEKKERVQEKEADMYSGQNCMITAVVIYVALHDI